MINSVSGSLTSISAASGSTNTTSIRTVSSQLIEALDLAGPNFTARALGSPREIGAGMTLLGRRTDDELRSAHERLGESDQRIAQDVRVFIEDGLAGAGSPIGDVLARATELNAMQSGQTRESRMQAVLTAGLEWLDSARGPALNLLNVGARTGLIVTLTTVLRQVVGFYVEQAIREGDSPQASQAWNVAAITMIGPALSLMGALRDEGAGTANLQTRLGRVCMASITMGALIAAHLTGASDSMLTSAINTTVYTVARDLCNAFFPLNNNAGAITAQATGVTTVAFGTVQFLLAELGALMPVSGPGRAAAGLGLSLGAEVIAGALNGVGAVIDDVISLLCRSWPLLSPSAGLEPAWVDPESLQQSVLEVRAGVRLPTAGQLGDALLNVTASRTSAFHAINLVVGAAAVALATTDHGENTQGHILNVCLMGMLMLIYFPFIWSCSQSAVFAKPAT